MSREWLKSKWGGIKDLFLSREGRSQLWDSTQRKSSWLLALLCVAIPFFPDQFAFGLALVLLGICIFISLLISVLILAPRDSIDVDYPKQHTSVRVQVGDLFDEADADLVIGFSDCFDTDISDGTIIAPGSVQGQFTKKFYNGDGERLLDDLEKALAEIRTSGKAHYETDGPNPSERR